MCLPVLHIGFSGMSPSFLKTSLFSATMRHFTFILYFLSTEISHSPKDSLFSLVKRMILRNKSLSTRHASCYQLLLGLSVNRAKKYMYVHTHIYKCICKHISTYPALSLLMCVWIHLHTSISISLSIYMYSG